MSYFVLVDFSQLLHNDTEKGTKSLRQFVGYNTRKYGSNYMMQSEAIF